MKSPVIILGMPRSGTSLLARYLHEVMGVSMGADFIPADDANPGGYYEDIEIVGLNKKLLILAGGAWDKPPNRKAILSAFADMREEMAAAGVSRYGWKDPRNSLTCWAWHELFPKARYIRIRRDRISVISSLTRWHGERDWDTILDVYRQHLAAFEVVCKPAVLHVTYENLVAYDYDTVSNLVSFLGVDKHITDCMLDLMGMVRRV